MQPRKRESTKRCNHCSFDKKGRCPKIDLGLDRMPASNAMARAKALAAPGQDQGVAGSTHGYQFRSTPAPHTVASPAYCLMEGLDQPPNGLKSPKDFDSS